MNFAAQGLFVNVFDVGHVVCCHLLFRSSDFRKTCLYEQSWADCNAQSVCVSNRNSELDGRAFSDKAHVQCNDLLYAKELKIDIELKTVPQALPRVI